MTIKRKLALVLLSLFSFQSVGIFASPYTYQEKVNHQILLANTDGYREHEYYNEEDDHSNDHNWKNHYHTIRSIRLKSNGNLKVRFCEKVELLEGQIFADNVKYDVKDAYKIRKRSIVWRLKKKNTFSKGSSVDINTVNFLGRPIEKKPNYNEIRSLEWGCGLIGAVLPNSVEVTESGSAGGILGAALLLGIGLGAGGSGSGSSSSN